MAVKNMKSRGNDGEGRFGRHDEGIYGKRTSERERKKLLPPSTPRVYIIRQHSLPSVLECASPYTF